MSKRLTDTLADFLSKTLARILVLVVMLMVCAGAPAQTIFSSLTAERVWQLIRPGRPAVSPDGKWVAFTVSAFAPDAILPSVDIWLTDSAGRDEPRQLTRNAGTDFDPAWAPDSRSIVYAAVPEGAENSQIFLLNLRGGAPQPLTDLPTSASNPRFNVDGTQVYFQAGTFPGLSADLSKLRPAVKEAREKSLYARASNSRVVEGQGQIIGLVQHVFSLDLASGVITDLMPNVANTGDVVPFHWDVSPRGSWLAFTANSSPEPYVSLNSDVFLMAMDDAVAINISADNLANDTRPVFSRAGGELLYARNTNVDALDEFRTLVSYSHRQRRTQALTDPQLLSPEEWITTKDGDQVYFLAQQRGQRKLFRVGASGGKARALTSEGSYSALTMDSKDQVFLRHESLLQPPVLQRLDGNGRHPVQLTRFNAGELENTRLPSVGEWTFESADGAEIHALMVYPPGWKKSIQGPVIIALHGGPHGAWLDEFNWRWNLALMASQGYVVAALNVRGSTGYGQAFASAVNGDPLSLPAADTLAAVNALAQQPFTHPRQISLVGGSFGGMLALWVLGQSSSFTAAVVHAPVVEQSLIYASDFPWGRHRTWGIAPWQKGSAAWANKSPLARLDQITTPLLALHGEADSRVPAAHSRLLHNVLTERGVPSRVVLFPGEGHVIKTPPASRVWWQELFSWLKKHQSN